MFGPLAIERRRCVVMNGKDIVAKFHGKRCQGYRLRKLQRRHNARIVKNSCQFFQLMRSPIFNCPMGQHGLDQLIYGLLGMEADGFIRS